MDDQTQKNLKNMIEKQIVSRGVVNPKILELMSSIDRSLFIPKSHSDISYEDTPVPIGFGQTISQPYIVALMTDLLNLTGNEKVLEIGTGSGYQTAIIANMAKEIYTIERIVELLERAKIILSSFSYKNIHFIHKNGYNGLPSKAPFDRILLTAAPRKIPDVLLEQLSEGGILVGPEGDYIQTLVKITRNSDKFVREEIIPVRFVPLISEE